MTLGGTWDTSADLADIQHGIADHNAMMQALPGVACNPIHSSPSEHRTIMSKALPKDLFEPKAMAFWPLDLATPSFVCAPLLIFADDIVMELFGRFIAVARPPPDPD